MKKKMTTKYTYKWIQKKHGTWGKYKNSISDKKLLKKAKEFFKDEKDAEIFVYDGVELDKKINMNNR